MAEGRHGRAGQGTAWVVWPADKHLHGAASRCMHGQRVETTDSIDTVV